MGIKLKHQVARGRKYLLQVIALSAAFALPLAARANTAANTQINNTATLNYQDGGGISQPAMTASVIVTVNLVQAAPTLSTPAPQTVQQDQPATLTYTITSNANGSDTYSLALPTDTLTNISAFTGGAFTPAGPITLGGTTLAANAVAGQTTIQVPCDGTSTSNGTTNGFDTVVGSHDKIVIGTTTYTIATGTGSINRAACTAGNNGNIVITLTSAIVGTTVTANTQVGESESFTYSFTHTGIVTVPTSVGSYNVAASAQASSSGPTGTSGTTLITVQAPNVIITKMVSTTGTASSWVTSASMNPGTTFFYEIAVNNTGTGTANAASITDSLAQYLTYVANSGKYATTSATLSAYTSGTALTDVAGGPDDGYTFVSPLITYTPGALGPTGTIAAGGWLVLMYKVTID